MSFSRFSISLYLSISYLIAELFELLVHKLGSPTCVVAGISVCSNIYFIKRIAERKKKGILLFLYLLQLPKYALAAIWQKKTDKKWKFQILVSTCTGRVYQLQDRSSCRMRYLHYPTLENTRSFIKRIGIRKKKDFSNFSTCYNCRNTP